MICPNCKVKLSENSKYCPRCGILFQSDDVEKYSESYNGDLLEIYFPNKEIGIHLDRISLGYMFFGGFYAIYKKMYYVGIISISSVLMFIYIYINFYNFFIESLGFAFYPLLALFFIPIIIYFYYLFNFNDLLIVDRKKRLQKILNENVSKSNEEIIKIIEKDSKSGIASIFITIFIVILMNIIFYFVLAFISQFVFGT